MIRCRCETFNACSHNLSFREDAARDERPAPEPVGWVVEALWMGGVILLTRHQFDYDFRSGDLRSVNSTAAPWQNLFALADDAPNGA